MLSKCYTADAFTHQVVCAHKNRNFFGTGSFEEQSLCKEQTDILIYRNSTAIRLSMSHVATSIAPAHHTGTSPDQVGRKAAHAFSITCMFQSLSHTHIKVAHTSASLAKACRYLASADCCSLRLCSSASSSFFCLASSICLISLHSHVGASGFNQVLLFSTLECNAETPHTVCDKQPLSHGQLVSVHKVRRCHCVCVQTQTQCICQTCQQVPFMPRGSAILHSEACGNCTCADNAESAVIVQPQNDVQTSTSSPFLCNQDARGHRQHPQTGGCHRSDLRL